MKMIILSPNKETLFPPYLRQKLESAGTVIYVEKIKPLEAVTELFSGSEERILAIDPDFCNWTIPNSVIDAIPRLKAICLQTTSFTWIDVDYCNQVGIPVMNLRGFSTVAVAEWATMMVLNLARKIPLVIKDGWKKDYVRHRGLELRGKVAGIIGLGKIGTAIAENLQGLGMNVQYWSRKTTNNKFKKVLLPDLFKTSDVIAIALAKNPETEKLIPDALLKTIKKTAIFVDVVHEVINNDLVTLLAASGKIYGYGFESNKPDFDKYKGNIWTGPELAWCTDDSMRKNGEQWAESIVKASKGEYDTRVK